MEAADGPPLRVLNRDAFTRRLIANLATETEAVVGRDQVREVIGLVGLGMGEEIERIVAPDVVKDPDGAWSVDELGQVLVELKARIDGGFSVESATRERVVLTNTRCPFAADVLGRPSLCMMTSSVFGGIAARHFGYARVDIDKAIARGDSGCRVTVHLREPPSATGGEWSEEYYGPA